MFTIMVGNLHEAAKEPELTRLFGGFGEVKRVIVLESMSPKFALVHMFREEEALAAVKATNGLPINQQPLQVEAYFA